MISSVGFTELLWFVGRVEEVQGSTAVPGRVRVRAFGIHPPISPDPKTPGEFGASDDSLVAREALPWAPVINGTAGGVSLMPSVGTMVIGFFIDGRDAQHPFVVGTIPGFNAALPAGSQTPYDDSYMSSGGSAFSDFGHWNGGITDHAAASPSLPEQAAIASQTHQSAPVGPEYSFEQLPIASGGEPDRLAVMQPNPDASNIQVGGDGNIEHISLMHRDGSHMQIDAMGSIKLGSNHIVQAWGSDIQVRGDTRVDISAGENCTITVQGGKATVYAADVEIVSRNDINFVASGRINLNARESVNIRGASVNSFATTDDVNISAAARIRVGASGALSLTSSGGNVNIKGTEVYIDDVVRLAEGGDAETPLPIDEAIMPPVTEGRVSYRNAATASGVGPRGPSNIGGSDVTYGEGAGENDGGAGPTPIFDGSIGEYSLTDAEIQEIIIEEATLRGIDPTVAVRIYQFEGRGGYQSSIPRSGNGSLNGLEASFGPYQLYTGGGLGNEYERLTGRSLIQDNTPDGIRNQVRFALDQAARGGWSPWYGRIPAGVSENEGLSGAQPVNNWN